MRTGFIYAGAGVGLLLFSSMALSRWPLLIWALAVLAVLIWESDSR